MEGTQLLEPRQVIQRWHDESFLKTESEITRMFSALALLDVAAIPDEQVQNVAGFWSRSMMLASLFGVLKSVSFTPESLVYVCLCGEVALQLHLRLENMNLPSLEPILCFIGCSDDIFNETELEGDYPTRAFEYDESRPEVQFIAWAANFVGEKKTCSAVCFAVMQCLLFGHKIPAASPVFDFVVSVQVVYGPISEEQFSAVRASGRFAEPIPAPEKSDISVPMSFVYAVLMVLFTKLAWKEPKRDSFSSFDEVRPCWACDCEKVACSFTMELTEAAKLMLLRQMKVDKEVFAQVTPETNPQFVFLYALYVNIESPFMTEFRAISLPENVKSAIDGMISQSVFLRPLDELLVNPNDRASATILLRRAECVDRLGDSKLHNIVRVFLSKDCQLPGEPSVSEMTSVMLFWHLIHKKAVDRGVLRGLLQRVLKALNECTPEKDFFITYANCPPFYTKGEWCFSNVPLPLKPSDFLLEGDLHIGVVCAQIAYLCVLLGGGMAEDDLIEMLASISLNWFSNGANQNYLRDYLLKNMGSVFKRVRDQKLNESVLAALKSSTSRPEVLIHLKNILSAHEDIMASVVLFILGESDEASFDKIYQISPSTIIRSVQQLNVDVQMQVVTLLIKTGNHDDAAKLIDLLSPTAGETIYSELARLAVSSPESGLAKIFVKLEPTENNLKVFLEHLPELPDQIEPGLLDTLDVVLADIDPFYVDDDHLNAAKNINVRWADDHVFSRTQKEDPKNGKLDLWEFPKKASHCAGQTENQPGFFCYTCGIVNDSCICLACAELCHAGHDLVLVQRNDYSCACGSACKAKGTELPELPGPDEEEDNAKEKNGTDIAPDVLLRLFQRLATCGVAEKKPGVFTSRLSQEVSAWPVTQMTTKITPSQTKFRDEFNGCLVNSHDFATGCADQLDFTDLTRRLQCSPVALSFACSLENVIVVASGNTLTAYSYTFEKLFSYVVPFVILELCQFSLDPTVFSVASLGAVLVMSISSSGFAVVYEIQLMLDTLGTHMFVNRVIWLKNSPLYLAVVCNTFLKVYDVATDCFCPMCCFMPDSSDFITSCIDVAPEDGEEVFCIVALNSGRIAVQSAGNQLEGPMPFTQFLKTDKRLPHLMTISACEENNLMFITAPNCDMLVCRLSDVAKVNENVNFITVELEQKVNWSFVHAIGPLHFFINPMTGAIMSFEITDKGFEVSMVSKMPNGSFPLVQERGAFFSVFSHDDDLFAIASTGKVAKLSFGAEALENDASDESDSQYEKSVIKVPPSFWTRSRSVTEGIVITCADMRQDLIFLNRGSHSIGMRGKKLKIKSVDPNQVIVGLKVVIGSVSSRHRSSWLKINGRRAEINGQRAYMLPVEPQDVGGIVNLELEENDDNDVVCTRIDVFVISKDEVPDKYNDIVKQEPTWLTCSTSVFDFYYDFEYTGGSVIECAMGCAEIINPGDTELDEQTLHNIVHIMYSVPSFASPCRLILRKCVKDRDRASMFWADEMSKMVRDKTVHSDSWQLFWRDFSLLPPAAVQPVMDTVWQNAEQYSGAFTVISAFSS